jgi:hypothetical protein
MSITFDRRFVKRNLISPLTFVGISPVVASEAVLTVPGNKRPRQSSLLRCCLGGGSDFYRLGMLGATLGGLFIPAAKETVEMLYKFDKPFVVTAVKFIHKFGAVATPHQQAI